MSEWRLTSLSELCTFKGGNAFPQDEQGRKAGDAPFIKVSDFGSAQNMSSIVSANNWVDDSQVRALKLSLFPAESTVFAKIGEGLRSERVRQLTRPTAIDNNLMAAVPNKTTNPRFLFYLLQTVRLASHAVGSALPYLKQSTLQSISVRVPELLEQQAIAEVLGALDDKIAANTALATVVDDYLAAEFESTFGAYPETTLSELAAVNETSVKPVPGGELKYVDIASVGVGTFEYPELSSWEQAPGRARRGLRRGDTLWSTVRPNRRSHALNLADDPLLVASTGLAVLTPQRVGFAFLYEATKRSTFTAYLENVAEGSAYPAVRADRFLGAPVPSASAQSIERFESVAAPLRESVFAASEENRTLAATRDALLPQLMSGKLRVRDAERVAAEAGA